MLHQLDPFEESRWEQLVLQHPAASVFHTRGWLRALQQTYGYEPVVITTAGPNSEIATALVFCRIRTWAGGYRWVSLPFSDHCAPLGNTSEVAEMMEAFAQKLGHGAYVEVRAIASKYLFPASFSCGDAFVFHSLDLRPELDSIFNRFHKDCIQRKIRRAEREGLDCREGGPELLDDFFRMYLLTRRRHGVPPAPRKWFANVIANLGAAAKLRLAYHRQRAVAGMLTLAHRELLVYKYGCSDASENRLGGMPFLFWKAIQDAKQAGCNTFDLGRSDLDAVGLLTFKERLGATPVIAQYATTVNSSILHTGIVRRVATAAFKRMPDPLLICAGRLLYPRVG